MREIDKIKSIKCFDEQKFGKCSNLCIDVLVNYKQIAYFCLKKEKEIIDPRGKRKCKHHEIRITEGMLGKIDMINKATKEGVKICKAMFKVINSSVQTFKELGEAFERIVEITKDDEFHKALREINRLNDMLKEEKGGEK